MKIYACGRLRTFLVEGIHSDIPDDAGEISQQLHGRLLAGQESGQIIDFSVFPPSLVARAVEGTDATERALRDGLLTSTEWLVARHRDEQAMYLDPTLTDEQFSQLLTYRQLLRDWPQSENFPEVLHRPVPPSWLTEQSQ